MAKSSKRSRGKKPSPKPYDDFPLTAHASGRWCKKHKGKRFYFGKLDEWEAAYEKYEREWPYIIAGRTPPDPDDSEDTACTLAVLCNAFLNSKRLKLEAGELARQTWADYFVTCERMIDHFGKNRRVDDLRPDDFEGFRKVLADQFGIVTLRNEINRCRIVLKYAYDNRLIDRPVVYGQSFNKPSDKMLRKARNAAGPNLFEREELIRIIGKADAIMRAMVLLGINCGFGNTDVANHPQAAVDLDGGWIEFPRPKTEINRRCPLWPETIEALKAAIAQRPKPKNPLHFDRCFITVQGNLYVRVSRSKSDKNRTTTRNTIADRFGALLRRLKINGRKRLGFYTLRHCFETVAGESRDQVAVDAIMGHAPRSHDMSAVYRERISDERLKAVTDYVRSWLWPTNK